MSQEASSAARDHDGFTPVFLFAHDYGTHLPYCEILQVETSIKCTCGFKGALETALVTDAERDRYRRALESLTDDSFVGTLTFDIAYKALYEESA